MKYKLFAFFTFDFLVRTAICSILIGWLRTHNFSFLVATLLAIAFMMWPTFKWLNYRDQLIRKWGWQ